MSSEALPSEWKAWGETDRKRVVRLFPGVVEIELYVNGAGGWAIYLNTNEYDPYTGDTVLRSNDVYPDSPARCDSPAAAMAAADAAWAALVEQWHNDEQQRKTEGGEA